MRNSERVSARHIIRYFGEQSIVLVLFVCVCLSTQNIKTADHKLMYTLCQTSEMMSFWCRLTLTFVLETYSPLFG